MKSRPGGEATGCGPRGPLVASGTAVLNVSIMAKAYDIYRWFDVDTGVSSCLNSTALVNKSVDRWLIDTGCGYDLVSRRQAASAKRWIRQASRPRTWGAAQRAAYM